VERVAFLLETGERLGCLLNPETLTMTRLAGVRPRSSVGGPLTGARLRDDPLLYTGGGRTELSLDLLFDITIAGSSINTTDVRSLTRPLWDMAENQAAGTSGDVRSGRPPLVTFVWGKSWNICGVVTAVAEKLEFFSAEGAPRRSWLRMRLLRVDQAATRRPDRRPPLASLQAPRPARPEAPAGSIAPTKSSILAEHIRVHEAIGGGPQSASGERLDVIASRYYGDASYWRLLAAFNGIDDPLNIPPGSVVRIPPASQLRDRP
jgi:Contractile injection system tube protein